MMITKDKSESNFPRVNPLSYVFVNIFSNPFEQITQKYSHYFFYLFYCYVRFLFVEEKRMTQTGPNNWLVFVFSYRLSK